jgi:hypothetical protein
MKDNRDPQVLGTALIRQRMEKNYRHMKLSQVADRMFSPSTTHDDLEHSNVSNGIAKDSQPLAFAEVQNGGIVSPRWTGTIDGMVPRRDESH